MKYMTTTMLYLYLRTLTLVSVLRVVFRRNMWGSYMMSGTDSCFVKVCMSINDGSIGHTQCKKHHPTSLNSSAIVRLPSMGFGIGQYPPTKGDRRDGAESPP